MSLTEVRWPNFRVPAHLLAPDTRGLCGAVAPSYAGPLSVDCLTAVARRSMTVGTRRLLARKTSLGARRHLPVVDAERLGPRSQCHSWL